MSCRDCNHFYKDHEGYNRCVLYSNSVLLNPLSECIAIERKFKEVGVKTKPVPIAKDCIRERLEAI